MKIAFITSTIEGVGGVEIFTKNLSRILNNRGHKVSVITLDSPPDKAKEENYECVLGEKFDKSDRENNYDVVICNGECGYAVEHPRAINIFHGGYYGYALSVKDLVPKSVTEYRLRKADMQKIAARGKYIVAVSNFSKEWLKKFGLKVDKVINNSIDTKLFYPKNLDSSKISDFSLALSRGRYYEKGFDILEKLANVGIKIKLFSDRKIESANVQNMGFEENKNLGKEYNQAQLLLFPSRFEGGSLTTLEAMACGCPILATPVGYGSDIKDIIPNFVVSDLSSITEFLTKHSSLINNRKEYSQKAIEYFWQFHNPETFKSQWISVVEGL